jgi:4-hydroxybenzoate polyprenyltransferase
VVTALSATLLVGLRAPGTALVLATCAVLTGQLSVGWSNDWVDAARDTAVGRADKPVVAGLVSVPTLRAGAVVAAAACAALSWSTGFVAGTAHVLAVASAWAYNVLLKRTALSPLPYAVSFGLLPVFLALAAGRGIPAWLVLAGALLGAGAHVANVLPDLEDDVRTAVRGLPHRLGRQVSTVLAPVLLVAATLVVVVGPGRPDPVRGVAGVVAVGLAVAAGVMGGIRRGSRAPFSLSMAVAGVCVLLLATSGPDVVG